MLDILYSKTLDKESKVFSQLFEIHENIPENPEIKDLIQSIASSQGFQFRYDTLFYVRILNYWSRKYAYDKVVESFKNVIPSDFFKGILTYSRNTELPKEVVESLFLHEITNSESSEILASFNIFNGMTLEKACELKELSESLGKTIKVVVSPTVLKNNLITYSEVYNPSILLFDSILTSDDYASGIKKEVKFALRYYVLSYEVYFEENQKEHPLDRDFISKLYPYYVCYTKEFSEVLGLFHERRKNTLALIENHVKTYTRLMTEPLIQKQKGWKVGKNMITNKILDILYEKSFSNLSEVYLFLYENHEYAQNKDFFGSNSIGRSK